MLSLVSVWPRSCRAVLLFVCHRPRAAPWPEMIYRDWDESTMRGAAAIFTPDWVVDRKEAECVFIWGEGRQDWFCFLWGCCLSVSSTTNTGFTAVYLDTSSYLWPLQMGGLSQSATVGPLFQQCCLPLDWEENQKENVVLFSFFKIFFVPSEMSTF